MREPAHEWTSYKYKVRSELLGNGLEVSDCVSIPVPCGDWTGGEQFNPRPHLRNATYRQVLLAARYSFFYSCLIFFLRALAQRLIYSMTYLSH